MQERGCTPSVIEEVIKNGVPSQDPIIDRLRYYDSTNNIGVVTDKISGLIITIRDGAF